MSYIYNYITKSLEVVTQIPGGVTNNSFPICTPDDTCAIYKMYIAYSGFEKESVEPFIHQLAKPCEHDKRHTLMPL